MSEESKGDNLLPPLVSDTSETGKGTPGAPNHLGVRDSLRTGYSKPMPVDRVPRVRASNGKVHHSVTFGGVTRVLHPGDGPAASSQHGDGDDRSTEGHDQIGVFSLPVRQRIREAMQETHGLVLERMRAGAKEGNQGHAASEGGLVAEIQTLSQAKRHAATQHGPAKTASMVYVRHAYLNIAASSILMGERVTRPEAPGGRVRQSKQKSPTERWKPLKLDVPPEDA